MADDCVTVFVEHVNMNLTTSGHYCISILPSQAFQSVLEVLAVKLEEIPLQEQRSIYFKLHRQEEKWKGLLKDAGVWRDESADNLKHIQIHLTHLKIK